MRPSPSLRSRVPEQRVVHAVDQPHRRGKPAIVGGQLRRTPMRVRTIRFLLLAAALVCLTLPVGAQRPSANPQALALGDPMPVDAQVTRGQLPNGLRSVSYTHLRAH